MLLRVFTAPVTVKQVAAEFVTRLPACEIVIGTEHVLVRGLTNVAQLETALRQSWARPYAKRTGAHEAPSVEVAASGGWKKAL